MGNLLSQTRRHPFAHGSWAYLACAMQRCRKLGCNRVGSHHEESRQQSCPANDRRLNDNRLFTLTSLPSANIQNFQF